MSLLLLRQKARDLQARTRRQLLGTLTVPLITGFFYAFSAKQFPDLRPVLHSLFTVALAWSIAGTYILNRESRSGALPQDAGFATGLEFCRQEIEHRRGYFRRDLLFVFGPVLLAIGTFIVVAGPAISSKGMPFLILVLLWIAAYFFMRARQQHELQRELQDLNAIASDNRR